jgi:hypothetical protein
MDQSLAAPKTDTAALGPVNSWDEWGKLEEIIVGRLEGSVIPPYHVSVTFNVPNFTAKLHRLVAGFRYPGWMLKRAQRELDGFVKLLEGEGVRVRRPDVINHAKRFRTPFWSSTGFCVAATRNGTGSGRGSPSTVTCRSSIASSSAACVFGGVRLISSARIRFANTGPGTNASFRPPSPSCKISVPVMSAGIKSGVNWIR